MSGYDTLYDRYMREANNYAGQYGIAPNTAHNGITATVYLLTKPREPAGKKDELFCEPSP